MNNPQENFLSSDAFNPKNLKWTKKSLSSMFPFPFHFAHINGVLKIEMESKSNIYMYIAFMIIIEFHNVIIYVNFSPSATKSKERSIFRFAIESLLCNLIKAWIEAL